jgi:hypothetical protein
MSSFLANVGAVDQTNKLSFYLSNLTAKILPRLYSLVQVNSTSGTVSFLNILFVEANPTL